MKKLALTAALGAACLALAACGDRDAASNEANDSAVTTEGADGNETAAAAGSSAAFPKGARIVEENGVTYRVNADGTRVALTAADSRIVIEGGKRFRVDPDGTRVRIDDDGGAIDIDLPDVDVGINDKGNPDIDVKDKDDGNVGPD
jgi:ABC-type glycerol-3-phosphate transport system substrate-binding protein